MKGDQLGRAEARAQVAEQLAAAGKAGLDVATTFAPDVIRTTVLKQKIARAQATIADPTTAAFSVTVDVADG